MSEDKNEVIARCLKSAKRTQGSIRRFGADSENWDAWTEDFEVCLREVMRLDPGNVEAPTLLGMHFLEEREVYDLAAEFLGTALKLKPTNKKLQAALAQAQAGLAAGQ